jgi:hypothetical protein
MTQASWPVATIPPMVRLGGNQLEGQMFMAVDDAVNRPRR